MEIRSGPEDPNIVPALAGIKGKCSSGPAEPDKPVSVGVSVIKRNLFVGSGNTDGLAVTNARRVREQGHGPAAAVHVLVPGPAGGGQERDDAPLGRVVVRLPTSPADTENTAENPEGADTGSVDSAQVALRPLVADPPGDVGGGGAAAALHDVHLDGGPVDDAALPGPSDGRVGGHQDVGTGDAALDDFISLHISSGTSKGYKYAYAKFAKFCSTVGACSLSCPPHVIANYLRYQYEAGASYNTINLTRSAISHHHLGYDGTPAGAHRLVCKAVKAVFRQRPPLPKYRETFDISMVFEHLKSLGSNQELPLKLLSFKALFLMIVSSLSRVSSAAALGPTIIINQVGTSSNCTSVTLLMQCILQDHCVINIVKLEKQSRPGHIRGHLRIQKFTDDLDLCPVLALSEYFNRVSISDAGYLSDVK